MFITDSSGSVVVSYIQEGFGNVLASSGSLTTNNYHLITKESDPDSGLYYFFGRWYDPEIGRFITKALYPAFIEHPYTYTENNPITMVDPDGYLTIRGHYDVTYRAAWECGFSTLIAAKVADVDRQDFTWPWKPDYSAELQNRHAMSGQIWDKEKGAMRYQTPGEFASAFCDYLKKIYANGDLAPYLHAIQDWYTPTHAGKILEDQGLWEHHKGDVDSGAIQKAYDATRNILCIW